MTEHEWLDCANPTKMLEFLRGKVSDRKLRLFACAYYRRWHDMSNKRSRQALEASEHFADRLITQRQLMATCRIAETAAKKATLPRCGLASVAISGTDLDYMLRWVGNNSVDTLRLLWDIFGNPFRTITIAPAILTWHDGSIPRLAQAIYDERQMPSGVFDPSRMNILADALLDAGCSDDEITQHCRSDKPHVRGCWVVDLLLGKS